MATVHAGCARPPLHLLASESDMVASLALQAEHRQPVVAAMLLEEIERAELHEPGTLPETARPHAMRVSRRALLKCQ